MHLKIRGLVNYYYFFFFNQFCHWNTLVVKRLELQAVVKAPVSVCTESVACTLLAVLGYLNYSVQCILDNFVGKNLTLQLLDTVVY